MEPAGAGAGTECSERKVEKKLNFPRKASIRKIMNQIGVKPQENPSPNQKTPGIGEKAAPVSKPVAAPAGASAHPASAYLSPDIHWDDGVYQWGLNE